MLRKSVFLASFFAAFLLSTQFVSAQLALTGVPPQPVGRTTLDFVNVTGGPNDGRIRQDVAEESLNEKEVEFGDFDNDGDPDVVVAVAKSDFAERRNKIYRNDDGVFFEVTRTRSFPKGPWILQSSSNQPGFMTRDVTRNAFLRDYDGDGWLDLITVNDSNNGDPEGITRFYHNKHPGDVFSHFAEETGRLNGAGGAACSAVSIDVDNANGCDLYLGNYPFNSQDTMYLNNGSGVFTEVTDTHVPTEVDYTVDVSSADLNGDGKTDLIVTSSFGDATYLVYNDLLDAGSGIGDYKYTGSRDNIGTTNQENAAEPADFNNDGKVDFYYCNRFGNEDRVYVNTGNNDPPAGDGKANFSETRLTGYFVSASASRKATVADFNRDGRMDVVVMGEGRRPSVLRNTSVNGQVSFVQWTPASAFPNGAVHSGWHAAAFDATGNGRIDIFVGGNANEHLFQNRRAPSTKERAVDGDIPAIHNGSPIAIVGNAMIGETDIYAGTDIPSGAKVSVVLSSSSNVALVVKNSSGGIIESIDRGGNGIEEAVQFDAPAGNFTIEVVMVGGAGSQKLRSYILEVLSRS